MEFARSSMIFLISLIALIALISLIEEYLLIYLEQEIVPPAPNDRPVEAQRTTECVILGRVPMRGSSDAVV